MNSIMHERIANAAVALLPEKEQAIWSGVRKELLDASNYPDLFFGLVEADEVAEKRDPEWMKYVVISMPDGKKFNCHRLEGIPNAEERMFACWFQETLEAVRSGNFSCAAKFLGCISHVIADHGQPAHLLDEKIASDLFLQGPLCGIFHSMIESLSGEIPETDSRASLLAPSPEALLWVVSGKIRQLGKRERAEIPVLFHGLEAQDERICQESAGRTALHCAELTADVMHTLYSLAAGLRWTPAPFDLCSIVPDSVLCDPYLNRDIMIDRVPGRDIRHPLPPDPGDGRKHRAIAMLPNLEPFIHTTREAWAEYRIPSGMFSRFTALVGLCRGARNEEGLAFEVLLDGVPAYSSGKVGPDAPPVFVDLPLGNASTLRLRAVDLREDAYRTKFYSPIWCDPCLHWR